MNKMPNKGVIHIFIGAPDISPSLPWRAGDYSSVGQSNKWEKLSYVYNNHGLHLPNISKDKMPADRELPGGDARLEQTQTPFYASSSKSNMSQNTHQSVTGTLPDLVSSTENCHITSGSQRPKGAMGDVYDCSAGSCSKTGDYNGVKTKNNNNNLGLSAETEFLTVLTCSQLAVQGHVRCFGQDGSFANNKMMSAIHPTQETVEVPPTESAHHDGIYDYLDGSLELFTQIKELGCSAQSLTSQQYENVQVNLQDLEKPTKTTICEISSHIGNSGNKRKKWITSSPSSHKHEPKNKSKKPKKSSFLKKRLDKDKTETTVKPLTLLKYCTEKTKEYNILVVVVHPCYVKEIQVKSGPNAGSTFPLATMMVLDQSDAEHKVLLWRSAAFWSLALSPGDIMMLTNVTVSEDRWNKTTFLQSTFRSHLINLGSCSTVLPEQILSIVDNAVLQELMNYVHTKHYYLKELLPQQAQKLDCIQYLRLAELQPEFLVHSVLKVNSITILKEFTYNFKGLQQNKIILSIEEVKGQTSTLILWGASISWCDQIRRKRDHIWVFKYLFSRKNVLSGDMELHTTPWSTCECLFDDDKRAIDFRKLYIENISPTTQMTLKAFIESKYSGEMHVKARVSELEFCIPANENILITQGTCITDIMVSLSAVIYSGCGKCKAELNVDNNCVYEQCFTCLPFHQVRTFYRPARMTITNKDYVVCANVPSDIVEKIFLNISPNLLDKTVTNFTDVTYRHVVADLCHSILADTEESYLFLIRSYFLLDENSIPLEQEVHVLDFHLDL